MLNLVKGPVNPGAVGTADFAILGYAAVAAATAAVASGAAPEEKSTQISGIFIPALTATLCVSLFLNPKPLS